MKVYTDVAELHELNLWQGAEETKDTLIAAGIDEDEIMSYLDEIFPDYVEDTELNNFLWFDRDNIYEYFNIDADAMYSEGVRRSSATRKALKGYLVNNKLKIK